MRQYEKVDDNNIEKRIILETKKRMVSNQVIKVADKFDDLLCITKPRYRDYITDDEVTEIFNYLRSELKRVERKVKKDKQPFTLTD